MSENEVEVHLVAGHKWSTVAGLLSLRKIRFGETEVRTVGPRPPFFLMQTRRLPLTGVWLTLPPGACVDTIVSSCRRVVAAVSHEILAGG